MVKIEILSVTVQTLSWTDVLCQHSVDYWKVLKIFDSCCLCTSQKKKKEHLNDKKRKSSVLGTSQKVELSGSTSADEKCKMAIGGTNPPASGSPRIW